ncbi:hypothetical protein MCAP1_001679 [Malassezia caprae]|uniref:Ribosomal RNA-processing protein 14 n=1 Tax=Malassezia caprae TaxID=1381934 RepID=A0AAF0IV56_9BASI|nr:hypothetical protein MCAP1_001679 [Malassezia caprae]
MAAAMDRPSSRGLYKSSLEAHTEAFEKLLSLIPAKFYVPPNDDQEIDAKYQKNKRTKSQKQQEAEMRKLRAKESKRAKLDPANAKSVEDVQAERRVDMDMDMDFEEEGGDDAEDAEDGDDDAEGAEEGDDAEEEKESAEPEPPAPRRASIAELRERLHSKIQMLHQQRQPHETSASGVPSTKEELLEERRRQRGEMRDRRRRERKEARRQAKAQASKATERAGPALGSARSAGALVEAPASEPRSAAPAVIDGDLSFSQVSFETTHAPDPQRKNKYALPSDPKSALAALEARQRREEAKIQKRIEGGQDAAQAREAAQESERWGKALAAAEGFKIRDNVNALKQTIKRRERAKEKSTKAWYVHATNPRNDRRRAEQEAQAAKQKRRMENLAARREAKKSGTKPKKSAKPSKARPGFEGSARSLGGRSSTGARPPKR